VKEKLVLLKQKRNGEQMKNKKLYWINNLVEHCHIHIHEKGARLVFFLPYGKKSTGRGHWNPTFAPSLANAVLRMALSIKGIFGKYLLCRYDWAILPTVGIFYQLNWVFLGL